MTKLPHSRNVGDISWCEHHLIWSIPAQEAVARQIPIVLYGECPQNEYGAGPPGTEVQTRLTKSWVDEFGGLLGLRLSDVAELLDIDPRHLELYRHPGSWESQLQAVFMGAYFPWDGRVNARISREHGFSWSEDEVEGTGCHYENLDNHQTGIHDYLRFLKFGYTRATDIFSNVLRRGEGFRVQAATLAREYDGQYPVSYLGKPLADILEPLGISRSEFNVICERFTNKPVVEWASSPDSYQCFKDDACLKGLISIWQDTGESLVQQMI